MLVDKDSGLYLSVGENSRALHEASHLTHKCNDYRYMNQTWQPAQGRIQWLQQQKTQLSENSHTERCLMLTMQ